MKKLFLAVIATALFVPTAARADVLVEIDLSVTDQITISSTAGLSAISTSGSDDTGIYFENFYSGAGSALTDALLSGDFTSAN
ncbi:MAG: U3 small nucleolar ribonucleoprotein component, partial [Mariniblastus sp.]